MLIDTKKGHIPYHRIISTDFLEVTYETTGGRTEKTLLNDRGINQLASMGKRWLEVLDAQNEGRLVPTARITSLSVREDGDKTYYEVNTVDGEVFYTDRVTHSTIVDNSIEVFDFGDVP